jgi:hypothetical protein
MTRNKNDGVGIGVLTGIAALVGIFDYFIPG